MLTNHEFIHGCKNFKDIPSLKIGRTSPPNKHCMLAVGVCRFQLGNNIRKVLNRNWISWAFFLFSCADFAFIRIKCVLNPCKMSSNYSMRLNLSPKIKIDKLSTIVVLTANNLIQRSDSILYPLTPRCSLETTIKLANCGLVHSTNLLEQDLKQQPPVTRERWDMGWYGWAYNSDRMQTMSEHLLICNCVHVWEWGFVIEMIRYADRKCFSIATHKSLNNNEYAEKKTDIF